MQRFDTQVFATPEDKSRVKVMAVPLTIKIHAGRIEQIYVGVLYAPARLGAFGIYATRNRLNLLVALGGKCGLIRLYFAASLALKRDL